MLRVDGLRHILLGPLPRFLGQLFEFVLLEAGLHIKIIGNLFLHVLVLFEKCFRVFAGLQLLYLDYRYFVQQVQNSQDVFASVVHVHLLERISVGVHHLWRLLRELTNLSYFLPFCRILAIRVQALLEHFLGSLNKLVDIV